jgi:hypothetical protein
VCVFPFDNQRLGAELTEVTTPVDGLICWSTDTVVCFFVCVFPFDNQRLGAELTKSPHRLTDRVVLHRIYDDSSCACFPSDNPRHMVQSWQKSPLLWRINLWNNNFSPT